MHKAFHLRMDEEKHQMLNLNHRLETYLNRVKHLEEENALLTKEIEGMRYNNLGARTLRKSQEEELRRTRLAVDEAWRDRVMTEYEVSKMTEELESLDLQIQSEAQARLRAKTNLEQSRKELEEEQRAQIWLKQKVAQLEQEMHFLIQHHQEDVANLEAKMNQSRVRMPQRVQQTPDLLQFGQEYSQRATKAWQEATEAYQFQLAHMEESLDQARGRLSQVEQEKQDIQFKLRALEKEIVSEHEVRQHLERTVGQQKDQHILGIQQLQEHMQELEMEKMQLGQKIDELLQENQALLKLKISLGLELTSYRALLDGVTSRKGTSFINKPRSFPVTKAALSPLRVQPTHQAQVSASPKTAALSSIHYKKQPTTVVTAPLLSKRSPAHHEITRNSAEKKDSVKPNTPYPKILEAGAVESFRPQEVCEKVTFAEPLSIHQEKEEQKHVEDEPLEDTSAVEPFVRHQMESVLNKQPNLTEDVGKPQETTEELFGTFDQSDKEASKEPDTFLTLPPLGTQVEEDCIKDMQEEFLDSAKEELHEPTLGSSGSSPVSECYPEEVRRENIIKEDATKVRQEVSCSLEGTPETDDKLYPDGEEMDTWDSVIERKIEIEADDSVKTIQGDRQHAEPEEDISAQECGRRDCQQSFTTNEQPDLVEVHTEQVSEFEELPNSHSEKCLDDEEDSQNVSVSWKTEFESDSYAQDNTLADTRPLIRYKSDETDIHGHISHADENESSESEQERKVGADWGEEQFKKFGTMEDLCEEGEGEMLDEEYDMGYIQPEERGEENSTFVSEDRSQDFHVENREETMNQGSADEENKELEEATKRDCDEGLETDRLVELELENLSTDSYSTHYADFQSGQKIFPLVKKKKSELEKPEQSKTEDSSDKNNHELKSVAHLSEQLLIEDPFITLQAAMAGEEGFSHEEGDKSVTAEHSVTFHTEVDIPKDYFDIREISRSDTNEVKISENPPLLQNQEIPLSSEMEAPMPVESPNKDSDSLIDDAADLPIISDSSKQTPPNVSEISKEPQEHLEKTVEDYDKVGHRQPSEPFARESNESEDCQFQNIDESQHLSGSSERPQQIMHESKESQELLKDSTYKNDDIFSTPKQARFPTEALNEYYDHQIEDVAHFQQPFSTLKPPQLFQEESTLPQAPQAHDPEQRVEIEDLENLTQSNKSMDQNPNDQKTDYMSESGDKTDQEEPFKNLAEPDQITLNEATEGEYGRRLPFGLENTQSWASSFDSSTTSQPQLTCEEATEINNCANTSSDNQVWRGLENKSGVNGNSQVGTDLFASCGSKEQEEIL